MLVDDLANDLLLLQRAFVKARVGNPVVTVSGGEEAISYLQGEGRFANRAEFPLPELILLDIKMPKVDGFEVLRWIRTQPGLKTIRVVVLTSSDQMKDVNEAYELGANSFLVKPVLPEQFFEMAKAINGYWLLLCNAPESMRSWDTWAKR